MDFGMDFALQVARLVDYMRYLAFIASVGIYKFKPSTHPVAYIDWL